MALAFPGFILYGIALFAVQGYIHDEKYRKVYHYLNTFGLMPWIALHLFYIMILSLYAWLIPVCEGLMLPVFLYWFYLQITGKTVASLIAASRLAITGDSGACSFSGW